MYRPGPTSLLFWSIWTMAWVVPAQAQTNRDSLKQVVASSQFPLERLRALRFLSKTDDNAEQLKYSRETVALADSMLRHGHANDRTVLGLKAGGLWNYTRSRFELGDHPDADSALVGYRNAAAIWRASGDKERIAFSAGVLATHLTKAGRPQEALEQLRLCLSIREEMHDTVQMAMDRTRIGDAYYALGDYPHALDNYLSSLELARAKDFWPYEAIDLTNIGLIYDDQGQKDTAITYYQRSIQVYARGKVPGDNATPTVNLAKILSDRGRHKEALRLCTDALVGVDPAQRPDAAASVHSTMCLIHRELGDLDQAIHEGRTAVSIAERGGSVTQQIRAALILGWSLHDKRLYDQALVQALRAKGLMESLQFDLRSRRNLASLLAEIYTGTGRTEEAFRYYKEYEALKDSVNSEEMGRKLRLMDLRKQEMADSLRSAEAAHRTALAHERAMNAEQERKRMFMYAGIGVLLVAGGLLGRLRHVRRSRAHIQREKDRSENLLLNILPSEIAQELKEKGEARARDIDGVSILFTDFKGFTSISEQLSAQELVSEIDACFKAFDGIIARYGVEKIKTIGDAYMCAGGLPAPSVGSAARTVSAALEMQTFMIRRKAERDAQGLPAFEMRVGIHTGPVVAGIVGVNKFQYDIWGDTVNTASRMESSGEVGQVNISEATYALVKDNGSFSFTPRGKVQAKGKGEMEMYFVDRA